MDEGQVKAAILTHIRAANGHHRNPVVTAEFSLGSSGVRADLAVFAETTIGFEIKTVKDTLRRLPVQMKAYARYFDHAVAIVAPCHIPHVTTNMLHGGSLWTFDDDMAFISLIEGEVNVVDNEALVDLMTQVERRRSNFSAAMATRYEATSRHFWKAAARRSVHPGDLPLLSRFHKARVEARRLAAEREARWARWLAAQDESALASA